MMDLYGNNTDGFRVDIQSMYIGNVYVYSITDMYHLCLEAILDCTNIGLLLC